MAKQELWYVKRGDVIKGPFPDNTLTQSLLLGRVRETDYISNDQENWDLVSNHKELYPAVLLEEPRDPEKIKLARIQADERRKSRRLEEEDRSHMEDERRRARDRRQQEDTEMIQYRRQHARVMASLKTDVATLKAKRPMLYLGMITVLLVFTGFILNPASELDGSQCDQQASPGINWSHCQLQGSNQEQRDLSHANLKSAKLNQANFLGAVLADANLAYADLAGVVFSYANLSGGTLKGANLTGADLSYANLSGADLSYANLTRAKIGGADFTDAKLDNVIWVDQIMCLRGSIGNCLRK